MVLVYERFAVLGDVAGLGVHRLIHDADCLLHLGCELADHQVARVVEERSALRVRGFGAFPSLLGGEFVRFDSAG